MIDDPTDAHPHGRRRREPAAAPSQRCGGGGLRGGRFLRNAELANRAHNQLLVAILHLFGDTRQSVGPEQYNSGPFPGLL